jgi:phosphate/sulfate permease
MALPLSTTHCIIGALAGVHICGFTPNMRLAYFRGQYSVKTDDEQKEELLAQVGDTRELRSTKVKEEKTYEE